MNPRPLNSKYLYNLIFLGCVLFALLKVAIIPFAYNTDFHTYIETAKLISGEEVPETFGFRILKPISPAFVALSAIGGHLMSYEMAFYFTVILFYGLLGIALFIFYRKIAEDMSEKAGVSTSILTWTPWIILMTSYPLVRYGIDAYLETGAWFLYVLGLYTTYLFYKQPTMRLALINCAVFCIGFFWKEYSAINVVIFAVIVLTAQIPWKLRIRYALVSGGIFIAINLLFQWFVYARFGYTYADWMANGVSGYQTEFTLYNISKTLFALLCLAWFFVPIGAWKILKDSKSLAKFLAIAAVASCMFLLWGWVSSRLYFVAAPIVALVAGYGIARISPSRNMRLFLTALVVSFQLAMVIKLAI